MHGVVLCVLVCVIFLCRRHQTQNLLWATLAILQLWATLATLQPQSFP